MLDHWLDKYEALWSSSATVPPSLIRFLEALPEDDAGSITRELALIDLEHRWRRFFPLKSSYDQQASGLSCLPLWVDYCRSLPSCEMNWLEGILHEFRVRQLFGDRPHYRHAMKPYPSVAEELQRRLPEVAAATTRATVTVLEHAGQSTAGQCYSCRLPGRLEIGRQRADEPPAPTLVPSTPSPRLLIANSRINYISRTQCQLEVVAKDRILVRHTASKGTIQLGSGRQLLCTDSRELDLPVALTFHGRTVEIEIA